MKKRVVVTGMGAVTPVGNNVEKKWESIKAGKNGIDYITLFDTAEHKAKVAAEVKDFDPTEYIEKKELRRLDRFCHFGIAAAVQAYNQSGLESSGIAKEEIAVITGSGIGGMTTWESEHIKLMERGPSKVSPFMIPMIIPNILAGNISIRFGVKGLSHCVVTACASGTDAIGEAYNLICASKAKAVITGGAEAVITPFALAGFSNMMALSTRNDPNNSSTPFDKDRDGFVMGEGAGMLILEDYETAKARGAKIYGEIVGYGATCDAYHITSPAPDGSGAAEAMRQTLKEAGIAPSEVSYINAHGTSTPPNDKLETLAIKSVCGDDAYNIPVSSTKSMTGHMLGAAGAVESIICIKALEEGFIPPTINLKNPDEGLDLDYVPEKGREQELKYAISNSLGFGGHNATLAFKRFED